MYLSLERIAFLSALSQAPGNGAGVSHKSTLQWMYIHIQIHECKHRRAHTLTQVDAYGYMDTHRTHT